MKYLNIMIITVLIAFLSACNRNEIFEREQYKHVISLLSEGAFNIFAEEHDPATGDEDGYTEGYVSASCGGSLPTTETVTLNLREDPELLSQYNIDNFATEGYRYAHYLPANRYIVENPVITIPQGERSGRMKIRLRAGGLSPDSVYFIPFRVEQCSAYELNPNKNTVLYQVFLKNFWASTKAVPVYAHRGLMLMEGSEVPVLSMMTKTMVPVSSNDVRIFAGSKIITEITPLIIEKWALRLSIDDNGKVTIRPWDESGLGMSVTQIDDDPEYPNVFRLVDDGYGKIYKTFLLCYDFINPDNKVKYRMNEELKIEYIPTVK